MITRFNKNIIAGFSRLHSKITLNNTNYYEILQVNHQASEDQIKLAYVKQSSKYHPQSPEHNKIKFDEIQEAFRVLANSKLRQEYDSTHRNVAVQQVKLEDNAQIEIIIRNGEINYTLTINKQELESLSNQNDAKSIAYAFMKDFINNKGGFQEHLKQINYDDIRRRETMNKAFSILYTIFQMIIRKK